MSFQGPFSNSSNSKHFWNFITHPWSMCYAGVFMMVKYGCQLDWFKMYPGINQVSNCVLRTNYPLSKQMGWGSSPITQCGWAQSTELRTQIEWRWNSSSRVGTSIFSCLGPPGWRSCVGNPLVLRTSSLVLQVAGAILWDSEVQTSFKLLHLYHERMALPFWS